MLHSLSYERGSVYLEGASVLRNVVPWFPGSGSGRFRLSVASTPTAPLPKYRVSGSQPFQVSGVDCAAPVFVKGDFTVKAYIVVLSGS